MSRANATPRRGFTLTELTIVIGLIVLLIALALPAFNALTGSRSVGAARTLMDSYLGRARSVALERNQVAGVAFFYDPADERVSMQVVTATGGPGGLAAFTPGTAVAHYLAIDPDIREQRLPVGVTVQQVVSYSGAGTAITSDAYTGFNPQFYLSNGGTAAMAVDGESLIPGPVVLFGPDGRLRPLESYAFRTNLGAGTASATGAFLARRGQIAGSDPGLVDDVIPAGSYPLDIDGNGSTDVSLSRSAVGFVLADASAFQSASAGTGSGVDRSLTAVVQDTFLLGEGYGSRQFGAEETDGLLDTEADEEAWLDLNGTPVIVNRLTGTLMEAR